MTFKHDRSVNCGLCMGYLDPRDDKPNEALCARIDFSGIIEHSVQHSTILTHIEYCDDAYLASALSRCCLLLFPRMPVFPLKMQKVALCTFLAISCLSVFATGRLTSSAPLEQQQQQQWVATHGAITSVPGYKGQLPSKHYGGYITVGNKQLYYYMVESERSPATDPVV